MNNDDDEDLERLFTQLREQNSNHHALLIRLAAAAGLLNHAGVKKKVYQRGKWGGRKAGSKTKRRGVSSWPTDYFGETPTNTLRDFRWRFRVPWAPFHKLCKDLVEFKPEVWDTKTEATGKNGIPTEVNIMLCLRYIGTSTSMNDLDDGAWVSEESTRQYV